MRAILVDDERLALEQLKKILEREIDGLKIVEMCSDSRKVVEIAVNHHPDVVFLDIHMPELDGLQLGEQLQAALPAVEIVFVTAYDQYAVKASLCSRLHHEACTGGSFASNGRTSEREVKAFQWEQS